MSEHERHTKFLRQCLLYDESDARHKLEVGIVRIQRDAQCVRRAAWLMGILAALVVAGLGYGVILVDNFLNDLPQSIMNLVAAIGLGSLISLLTFVGLGMVYRMKLDQRREECRHLVAQLLESRLGKPVPTPPPNPLNHHASERNGRTVPVADRGNGSPGKTPSASPG